jgi:hypothetical protein
VKAGRNDPCPCGSGKKYKHCCYGKELGGSQETGPAGVFDELRQLIQGKDFGSLREAQAFVGWHTGQKNRAPVDDFEGLSPEQMHRFLHYPFASPDLATFPERLATPAETPIVRLFGLLAEALGEKGLKTTVTGNLPLNFVREAALVFLTEEERTFHRGIRTELEFFDLHATRLVSGLAGLTRKYQGRFVLTSECRKLMEQDGMAAVYPLLFRAFVEKYNWAYRDRYPSFGIIQQSFLFSLWLFNRFGDVWRAPSFYEDCFLRAFPAILGEAESERSYTTPEKVVRSCYAWRCLEGFAVFLGLMEIDWESRGFLDRRFTLRKSRLLNEVVTFHL